MKHRVTVTEAAIRQFINEAFENKDAGVITPKEDESAVNVNDVVDQSALLTDPMNDKHTPQNRVELGVAIDQLSKDIPSEKIPSVYDSVVKAIDISKKKDAVKMKKDTKAEAVVRRAVRKMIEEGMFNMIEAPRKEPGPVVGPMPPVKKIPAGVHGGEYNRRVEKNKADLRGALKTFRDDEPVEDDDTDGEEDKKKFSTMSDVQGASFHDIATELGFSVAGAKQAVDKALQKAQWLGSIVEEDPEALEIMALSAISDYIKHLSKSGELTAADVQLMKDHPDIVRDLDGFREFFDKSLRAARKATKVVNPVADEDEVTVNDVAVEPEVVAAPVAEPVKAAPVPPPASPVAPKAKKDTYKIYKGGAKYGDSEVVTRYKGKVYGSAGRSKFKAGEQGAVAVDNGKLKVTTVAGDHTQTWDPVEESVKGKNMKLVNESKTRTIKSGNLTIILEKKSKLVEAQGKPSANPHAGCSLGYDEMTDTFFIEGAKPGHEENGDWDEKSQTYFEVSLSDVNAVAPHVGKQAKQAGLSQCKFTVSGSLLAIDPSLGKEVAVYVNGKWVAA